MLKRHSLALVCQLVTLAVPILICSSCGTPVAVVKSEQASMLDRQGKREEALILYSEALEADPNYVIALMGRATVYQDLGRLDKGIEDLDKCIELTNGSAPEPFANRGIMRLFAKDYRGAVDDFSTLIRLDPDDGNNYAMRAEAYIWLGKLDRAQSDCDKAKDIDPKNYFPYRVLGILSCSKKQYKEGIQWFTKALELQPGDAEVLDMRARAYDLTNQHDLAERDRSALGGKSSR